MFQLPGSASVTLSKTISWTRAISLLCASGPAGAQSRCASESAGGLCGAGPAALGLVSQSPGWPLLQAFTHSAVTSQGPGAQEGSRSTGLVFPAAVWTSRAPVGPSWHFKDWEVKTPEVVLASRLTCGPWSPADWLESQVHCSPQQVVGLLGDFVRHRFFSPPHSLRGGMAGCSSGLVVPDPVTVAMFS